jgi:anti-sigma B factor antagonist
MSTSPAPAPPEASTAAQATSAPGRVRQVVRQGVKAAVLTAGGAAAGVVLECTRTCQGSFRPGDARPGDERSEGDSRKPTGVTARAPGFEVERAPLFGAPGVVVRGDVDIDTAPRLTQTLDAAIRETRGPFVVDLSEVSFLDSSGVHLLLRTRAVLGREDRALVVICPPGPARRIFEVAGITDLFPLFESRDRAAALLQPGS